MVFLAEILFRGFWFNFVFAFRCWGYLKILVLRLRIHLCERAFSTSERICLSDFIQDLFQSLKSLLKKFETFTFKWGSNFEILIQVEIRVTFLNIGILNFNICWRNWLGLDFSPLNDCCWFEMGHLGTGCSKLLTFLLHVLFKWCKFVSLQLIWRLCSSILQILVNNFLLNV